MAGAGAARSIYEAAGGQGLDPSGGAQQKGGGEASVVEVVRGNFREMLPQVLKSLSACDFVALDAEFTGLSAECDTAAAARARKVEVLDDLDQRYDRVRASAQNFLIMQLGLSMVRWDRGKCCFLADTYNFYLFPVPNKFFDARFLCQASSLHFLAQHGFDFNKFVYHGIPFLSQDQLRKERRQLEASHRREKQRRASAGAYTPPTTIPSPADRLFLGQQLDLVRQWVASTEPSPVLGAWVLEQRGRGYDYQQGSVPMLALQECNSALRATLYQQLEDEYARANFYAHTLYPEGRNSGWGHIHLVRATAEQVLQLEEAKRQLERQELEDAAGFGLVVEQLVQAGKPLVGHNCLLDLAYFSHQLLQPLPSSLDQFRSLIREAFPGGVYDTKHLVTSAGAIPRALFPTGTSLGTVFSLCSLASSTCLTLNSPQGGIAPVRICIDPSSPSAPATSLWEFIASEPGRGGGSQQEKAAYRAGPGCSFQPVANGGQDAAAGDEAVLRVRLPPVLPGWPALSSPPMPATLLGLSLGSKPAGPGAGPLLSAAGGAAGSAGSDPLNAVSHAHDAGYDALMTGTVFASLAVLIPALAHASTAVSQQNITRHQGKDAGAHTHYMDSESFSKAHGGGHGEAVNGDGLGSSPGGAEAMEVGLASCASSNNADAWAMWWSLPIPRALEEHRNYVHVMRCDVPYLPLTGTLPTPDRSATFLLSNIPASASSASLSELFAKAGLGDVRLVWLDSSNSTHTGASAGESETPGGAQRQRLKQASAGEQANRRIVVSLWDMTLAAAAPGSLLDVAPSLCLTPWDSIPKALRQSCIHGNGGREGEMQPPAPAFPQVKTGGILSEGAIDRDQGLDNGAGSGLGSVGLQHKHRGAGVQGFPGFDFHPQPDVDPEYSRQPKAPRTEQSNNCQIM